ncbi:hypothetical protein RJ640_010885 [Escallonia rubra]|uniref:DUF4283 domain-containing protein n=1 Tax=Escallonia rubra TaxID=112253 RepID=A0AA88QJ34_9ASTE|nr:hypothetical protein RJ640_010885 [Escallonia rubra]
MAVKANVALRGLTLVSMLARVHFSGGTEDCASKKGSRLFKHLKMNSRVYVLIHYPPLASARFWYRHEIKLRSNRRTSVVDPEEHGVSVIIQPKRHAENLFTESSIAHYPPEASLVENHHHSTPSTGEPPPVQSQLKTTFKDTLPRSSNENAMTMDLEDTIPMKDEEQDYSSNTHQEGNPHNTLDNPKIPTVALLLTLKLRIRQLSKITFIIEVLGQFFTASSLTLRLVGIWRPIAKVQLIELSNGFHIAKFTTKKDYRKALKEGPWFVGTSYQSMQRWKPNFDMSNAKIPMMAVWF